MSTYHQAPYAPSGVHAGQAVTPSAGTASAMHSGVPVHDPTTQQHMGPVANVPGAAYGAGAYLPLQGYPPQSTFLGFNFQDQQLWKGVILGAGITFLLTNDNVQKSIIKGTAKLYGLIQGGVQEIKEKFEDVQAEMRQESKGE